MEASNSTPMFVIPKKQLIAQIDHRLNTAHCQFTSAASKTKKAIQFLKHQSILHRFIQGEKANGTHHMTIVLTNNSLLETNMWKFRLSENTKESYMNIFSLSSKKSTNKTHLNSINQLFTLMQDHDECNNASKLPDILVMCTHGARTEDVIKILKHFMGSRLNLMDIGIHQITTTVMFDEADKNISLIVDFLKSVNSLFFADGKNKNTVLKDIHQITATAFRDFWKNLAKVGVKQLKNINTYLKENEVLNINFEELHKDYRKINDHTIQTDQNLSTEDTKEYAEIVLNRILKDRAEGKRTEPFTVFAPAMFEVTSHDDMATLFTEKKFIVLILNGQKKGFLKPDGTFESLEEQNTKHNVQGELRVTLKHWREKHPNIDLAITGYLSVERGVTFNTSGFEFSDMIVSCQHLRNESALIQILGRANGEAKQVRIFNIWAPKKVISRANELIGILNDLHHRDPEVQEESDFRKKSRRDIMEPAMTIPISVPTDNEEEWNTILSEKKGRIYNEAKILAFIASKNPGLADDLTKDSIRKKQITMPSEEKSIKKHIEDALRAVEGNKTFSIDITKKEMYNDVQQIFLDSRRKQLIVSIHWGSRIEKSATDDSSSDESEE